MKNLKLVILTVVVSLGAVSVLIIPAYAQQKMDRVEKQSMKTILGTLKKQIEKNYYDPEFHGINIEDRFEAAKKRLDEVDTTSQALGVIAQVLLDFNDSHLFFYPPLTNIDVEYGYRTRMVGENCFVSTVKPKSDAEVKGLKAGDQLLSIQGFRPNRKDMWKINYFFGSLAKRSQIELVVLKPGSDKPLPIVVESKITERSRVVTRDNIYQLIDTTGEGKFEWNITARFGNVAYWKLPSFGMEPNNVDTLFKAVSDAPALVLDLRGNGGGAVVTLERLAAYFFDKDFVLATPKGRKDLDPIEVKSKGNDAYRGKLVVLIDSGSGSASELFARTVQLRERGVVVGDVSAGAVMMSRPFVSSLGNDAISYGASITIADVIMPDDKSLENTGVVPNELLVPTAADLAAGRDPVLAKAVKLIGGDLTPEDAGGMFEYEWNRNDDVYMKPSKKNR